MKDLYNSLELSLEKWSITLTQLIIKVLTAMQIPVNVNEFDSCISMFYEPSLDGYKLSPYAVEAIDEVWNSGCKVFLWVEFYDVIKAEKLISKF